MNLRFSARGNGERAIVHLSVAETLHFGELVRRRGEALCRPRSSLPNLEALPRQVLADRPCCLACVAVLARIRRKHQVALPAAAGVVAGDLVRLLEREQQAKPRVRRRAVGFMEDGS